MNDQVDVRTLGGELTLTKGDAELVYRWNPEPSASNDPQNLLGIRWRLTDGGYAPAGAVLMIAANSRSVDVRRGTLVVTDAGNDPVLTALGDSPHVWSIENDRLRIVLDDVQGRALVFTSDAASPSTPLAGTDWRLTSASDGNTTHGASAGQTLRITGAQLSANDGVNTLGGAVAIDGGTLTLSNISTTDIGALDQDPVRDLVDAVLTDGDVEYAISGDTLTLTRDANVLTFQAHSPTPDAPLAGSWNLTTIEQGTGPDGTASNASGKGPLVLDGDFANFTDCVTARAQVAGSVITFGTWADNLLDCSGGLTDIDQNNFVFGKILAGDTTYAIDGNTLTITKDGVGAIVLTRAQ